jgi:hypothetical protein
MCNVLLNVVPGLSVGLVPSVELEFFTGGCGKHHVSHDGRLAAPGEEAHVI